MVFIVSAETYFMVTGALLALVIFVSLLPAPRPYVHRQTKAERAAEDERVRAAQVAHEEREIRVEITVLRRTIREWTGYPLNARDAARFKNMKARLAELETTTAN